ncbi:GNAT family N-acetyltransferase [Ilumatobacter sp.]|uniref:GNAT family N-acetyltransferase n=1 Tax=Ilumatobacter sp. TaxID=1967498 RepID=UPI003AF989E6
MDHQVVPTAATLDAAVEHALRKGARSIRTSALFPAASAAAASAGFEPIDRLTLLQLHLDDGTIEQLGTTDHRIRTLQPWMHGRAAEVDRAAFGPMWGNDAAGLRDVRRATPVHRARMVGSGRRIEGFALSGAAAESGYLQRIAVSPEHRRRGIARDLVVDALGWMHSNGRTRCLVNTGADNGAALALYEHLGFERLADELTIAERRLTG